MSEKSESKPERSPPLKIPFSVQDALRAAMEVPPEKARKGRPPMRVVTSQETIEGNLRSYGEDELATRVPQITETQLLQIQERAGELSLQPDTPSGAGMLLAKAVALAAVEVLEGQPRPLKRKRRKPLG